MAQIRRGDPSVTDHDYEKPRQKRPGQTRPKRPDDAKAICDERGRTAEKPSDIPSRGWKDILWRVYQGISEDRILANAAAVTFYALLALFPAIAALVSIYGLFADPATLQQHLDSVSGLLPGGAVDVIRDQLTGLLLSHGAPSGSASSSASSFRCGALMAGSKHCSML